jgi:hypothetical protein
MKLNEYKAGMYVCTRKEADAAVYLTGKKVGFACELFTTEESVSRSMGYTDISIIEPATENQLGGK